MQTSTEPPNQLNLKLNSPTTTGSLWLNSPPHHSVELRKISIFRGNCISALCFRCAFTIGAFHICVFFPLTLCTGTLIGNNMQIDRSLMGFLISSGVCTFRMANPRYLFLRNCSQYSLVSILANNIQSPKPLPPPVPNLRNVHNGSS